MEVPEDANMESDLAPDADELGDELAEELSDLVTDSGHMMMRDEVDRPPNPEEQINDG